jgi:hypothetical protein
LFAGSSFWTQKSSPALDESDLCVVTLKAPQIRLPMQPMMTHPPANVMQNSRSDNGRNARLLNRACAVGVGAIRFRETMPDQ